MRLVLWMFDQRGSGPQQANLLRRALGLFGLLLVAVTWRLWTPQHVFPQVPLVRWAGLLPSWCDWIGLAGMVVGLLLTLVGPARGRTASAGLLVFAGCTAAMFAIDQQRLQPWAYQLAIVALVLALSEPRAGLALLRLFIVSFYFHSALTKLDYTFLHTLGLRFLRVIPISLDNFSDATQLKAAAAFPVAEMIVALGLCFVRTRLPTLFAAVVLHLLLLLLILGPWGLDHKPSVLVWNAYFIVQDVILFGSGAVAARWARLRRRPVETADEMPSAAPNAPWPVQALVYAAALLPFLQPTAWFDMWPSWGLYAPSAERVTLLIHRRELDTLDKNDPLLAHVEVHPPLEPWLVVRLDRWAIDALGVPIYPQNRFQLGVVQAVIAHYAPGNRARVVRSGLAARMTGRRQPDVLHGLPQLITAGDEYHLNARPRPGMFEPIAAQHTPPPAAKPR